LIGGICWIGDVPALRIAMVGVPPLLADLVQHGLASRTAGVAVTEIADLQRAAARLRDAGADVVVLGPAAPPEDAMLIRRILPDAQVLTVSSDLARLVDLDTGADVTFTPDALFEYLRR
jgi:DNA-binding response OmpR family regulator